MGCQLHQVLLYGFTGLVKFVVSSRCLHAVSLLFAQGEEGDQGSPGEVGAQGPVVRYYIY